MFTSLPTPGKKLSKDHLFFLKAFTTACRRSILEMTTHAQSGHPGGSLSCIDFLSLVYTFRLAQTGEPIVISNGHVSPAVYAILAELGYIEKQEVIEGFRSIGSPYEGHVSRHVPGVWYGTGPLGIGVSAASGFAWAAKYIRSGEHVFATLGDGEAEEGQVYEMLHAAKKYKLDNLIVFLDYNHVQLSDSLHTVMPYDPRAHIVAAGWHVIDVDGHDAQALWRALKEAVSSKGSPVCIVGKTVMGKGVSFMEAEGTKHHATWHGKAATEEQIKTVLDTELVLTDRQEQALEKYRKTFVSWKPSDSTVPPSLAEVRLKVGNPRVYDAGDRVDCRSAYGNALLDLATKNKNIVALTADLAGSVKTDAVEHKLPLQHIDVGIAEQQMVSMSGAMSLDGLIPFCSTFGAFMTSRAKDQARVNDINNTNVKMVATHAGLSVGEDGPTHQAIDDSGSMLGLLNTMQMEPADANQCDRMIRYAAAHYGNMYVRMGRHTLPVITKQNGSVYFDADYEYTYGKCDVILKGTDVTIAAMGGTVAEAVYAFDALKDHGISAEIVVVTSIKQFDKTLFFSIKKTGRVLTVEDHNPHSGLATTLSAALREKNITPSVYKSLAVKEYQLSGTWDALYSAAEIDRAAIVKAVKRMIKK